MTLNYKISFSTPFFEIEEAIISNDLNDHPYYRMTGCDSVICCVMTLDGKFVMIEQFRPNIEEYSLEFPAGGIKVNENPISAAKREFSEEAKAVFGAGRELWKYYHSKPFVNVNASLYDIREYFQGRNDKGRMNSKSDDETYMGLIGELRNKLDFLADKIKPKVYEYGFLKK